MPTASEIIQRVKARYAGCRTYEDEGVVTSGPTRETWFRTAFVRPTCFFFEYTEEISRGVAWRNETGTYMWSTLNVPRFTKEPLTLESAVACFTGVSGSSAYFIPYLLTGEIGGNQSLPNGATTSVIDRENISGRECFVLLGSRGSAVVQLWVDVSTWAVHKETSRVQHSDKSRAHTTESLRAQLADPLMNVAQREILERVLVHMSQDRTEFVAETTIVWHPRMDHDIDPKAFEFTPPG